MVKQTSILRRKLLTGLLVVASAAAAYATLGDGSGKTKKSGLLSNHYAATAPGKFSLKSGYQYRGSQIISQSTQNNVISLHSVITYQKGNTTYIVPLKTNVNTTDKVRFSLGIPSLQK